MEMLLVLLLAAGLVATVFLCGILPALLVRFGRNLFPSSLTGEGELSALRYDELDALSYLDLRKTPEQTR